MAPTDIDLCLDLECKGVIDGQTLRQSQRQLVPAIRLDKATNGQKKRLAFVPTMRILDEEFPCSKDKDSVDAFSHKASRETIEHTDIPRSLFSHIEYKHQLNQPGMGAQAAVRFSTAEGSGSGLSTTESWRASDTYLTKEHSKHRKNSRLARGSMDLDGFQGLFEPTSTAFAHQRRSSNSSDDSNVALCGSPNSASHFFETQLPRRHRVIDFRHGERLSACCTNSKTSSSAKPPPVVMPSGLAKRVSSHAASLEAGRDSNAVCASSLSDFDISPCLAVCGLNVPVVAHHHVDQRVINRKRIGSKVSMLSVSIAKESKSLTNSALPSSNAQQYQLYTPRLHLGKRVHTSTSSAPRSGAYHPMRIKKLSKHLIDYFATLGLSGRLVYCFGLLANESAIRFEPFCNNINFDRNTRTITSFIQPAQMLLLGASSPASCLVKAFPCLELVSGSRRTIHRLERDLSDCETNRVQTLGSSTAIYVDYSLIPIVSREVYSAVEVCYLDWTNYNQNPLTGLLRPHAPVDSSPEHAAPLYGIVPTSSSPHLGRVPDHTDYNHKPNVKSVASGTLTQCVTERLIHGIDTKSLVIPSYESLHYTISAADNRNPAIEKGALDIPSYASLHPTLSGKQITTAVTVKSSEWARATGKDAIHTPLAERLTKPLSSQSYSSPWLIEGPCNKPARWISPCPGGRLIGDVLVRDEPRFSRRRVAAQYRQSLTPLALAEMPFRRRAPRLYQAEEPKVPAGEKQSMGYELQPVGEGPGAEDKSELPQIVTTESKHPSEELDHRHSLTRGPEYSQERKKQDIHTGMTNHRARWIAELFPTLL